MHHKTYGTSWCCSAKLTRKLYIFWKLWRSTFRFCLVSEMLFGRLHNVQIFWKAWQRSFSFWFLVSLIFTFGNENGDVTWTPSIIKRLSDRGNICKCNLLVFKSWITQIHFCSWEINISQLGGGCGSDGAAVWIIFFLPSFLPSTPPPLCVFLKRTWLRPFFTFAFVPGLHMAMALLLVPISAPDNFLDWAQNHFSTH